MLSLARRRRRVLTGLAILALILVAADQVVLRVPLRDGEFLRRRIAPFDPPLFNGHHRQTFERMKRRVEGEGGAEEGLWFDGKLGWGPRKDATLGDSRFDWAGCRTGVEPLRRERQPGLRRIVAVGCSFTFGAEVAGEDAWPAVLDARRDDLEIANLGVPGYGIDQALLRYLRDGRPLEADEVWLGFLPSAALRPQTVHRAVLRHWGRIVHFKPRFELDSGEELVLVQNPAPTIERALHLLSHQADYYAAVEPYDSFVRRWPSAYAPEGSRLVHHSGFGRLLLTALEHGGRDALVALSDPGGETQRLCAALCRRLRDEAAADGARFRFFVLPGAAELEHARAHARPSWAGLVEALERDGIEAIDLTPELPGPGDPDWDRMYQPGSHYTVFGNRLVADLLEARIDGP